MRIGLPFFSHRHARPDPITRMPTCHAAQQGGMAHRDEIPPQPRRFLCAVKLSLMLAAMVPLGCIGETSNTALSTPGVLALKLYRTTSDQHYSYFVLKRDGTLAFGGGRKARTRTADPVGTLTAQEKSRLRETIEQHRLVTLKTRAFAKATSVTFEISLRVDGSHHSFRAIDDGAAALQYLHDQLMAMYSQRAHKLHPF